MNQFTSRIDFSLTKKRLKMMGKKASIIKNSALKTLLLPAVLVVSVSFCTSEDLEPYSHRDPKVELAISSEGRLFYNESGEPYSGESKVFQDGNNRLLASQVIENGRIVSSTYYYRDSSVSAEHHLITYDGRKKVSYTAYYKNGNKMKEFWDPMHTYPELGYVKEWYEDGTLKSEYSWGPGYVVEGYVNLYDTDGTLIEQELYDKGQLIEKIK